MLADPSKGTVVGNAGLDLTFGGKHQRAQWPAIENPTAPTLVASIRESDLKKAISS